MIKINGPIGAIEAGGTKFVCAFGSSLEDIKCSDNRIELPTGDNPHEKLVEVIQWFKNKEIEHGQSLKSIGIASFGPICLDRSSPQYGYITSTPKPNWSNFNIVGTVRSAFPGIPIGFDTDVNGAALGEWQWGAAQGLENFVYITIGTGIGAGGMINGRLLHGLMHPEMGHMRLRRIDGDSFPGVCAFHRDCWEGLCSGLAMRDRAGEPAEMLSANHEAWNFEIDYTAQAIVNIICALSPQRIILGGSVCKGGALGRDSFLNKVRGQIRVYLNNYIQSPCIVCPDVVNFIVSPALEDHAGIAGALLLGHHAQTSGKNNSTNEQECSCKMTDTCYSESWKKAFDIVKLENELINHRLTSLLATNAFLFTGVYFTFKLLFSDNHTPKIAYVSYMILYIVISMFGILSSYITGKGVRAASRQIRASSRWLYHTTKDAGKTYKNKVPLPPIVGIKTNFLLTKNEDSYKDEYQLGRDETDDIQIMSAGLIYMPHILFFTWIFFAIFGIAIFLLTIFSVDNQYPHILVSSCRFL